MDSLKQIKPHLSARTKTTVPSFTQFEPLVASCKSVRIHSCSLSSLAHGGCGEGSFVLETEANMSQRKLCSMRALKQLHKCGAPACAAISQLHNSEKMAVKQVGVPIG